MEKIYAADIRELLPALDREIARNISSDLNAFATARKVAVWELSLEKGILYLDGWNAAGSEVCHKRVF